jgi:hypothetical protein
VLQVSNAAAQLMADSLLGRGILCFKRRIRGDVLRQSSVPMISSGSRSRLKEKNRDEVKHEIT